ncbi:Atxe2 family lasso peptide isopeptidase [Altererythrobacter sp. B11]|uniref:Atxe2 family lasso peptide isopeptidase n=1 Tax=Altererythrobacter sp. B11 TaxID=2060312 RepID=UPI001E5A286C|nr:Atxe2 family lasso peptide isopeptidase [Altererythrobacter sp. B11]
MAVLLVFFAQTATAESADLLLSHSGIGPADGRVALTAAALSRLIDIGPISPTAGVPMFTASPDGKKIAFQIRQGDPESNSYNLQMVVVDLTSTQKPLIVDEGGEIILLKTGGLNGTASNTGVPATISPQWDSSGSSIYFLKRSNGRSQIWRASSNRRESEQITSLPDDVDDFLLTDDRQTLIYTSVHQDLAHTQQLAGEAKIGYRYDARFVPLYSNVPESFAPSKRRFYALSLKSGNSVPLDSSTSELFEARTKSALLATTRSGWKAWATASDGRVGGSNTLSAVDERGQIRRCTHPTCTGIEALWWTADGKRVRYVTREGWANSATAIYEWSPGRQSPNRIYSTNDLLLDCQPSGSGVLCAREQSIHPRHIVYLDLEHDTPSTVFDPNPSFQQFALGQVERLRWRNSFGLEVFGDLVYPVGYQRGRRYPLVVVQYVSRGFLRGGVGDEVPIQVFANRGFAVLSIQRPDFRIPDDAAKTRITRERWRLRGFRDRRSVLSAIEVAVRMLVNRGIVSRQQVGITGLSDGSSTVQFAALNSNYFKAGSVSGCCWDPFQDAFFGPSISDTYHQIGWPALVDYRSAFWRRISLIGNAHRVKFPILMQQADAEFRGAVASYTALRQAGKSPELYVYPGEYHIKWQPAHRLAVYVRNLTWFDYWLRNIGNPVSDSSDN